MLRFALLLACSSFVALWITACRLHRPTHSSELQSTTSQATRFVEDFEAGMLRSTMWLTAGDVELSDAQVFRGRQALHLTAGATWEARATLTSKPAAWPSALVERHFGRMMVFMPDMPPDGVHWNLVTFFGTATQPDVAHGQAYDAELSIGGMHRGEWLASFDTPAEGKIAAPPSDCWQESGTAIPTGRWICVQWHVDSLAKRMQLWVDGKEVLPIRIQDHGQACVHPWPAQDWAFPALAGIELGYTQFDSTSAMRELWLDDLELSSVAIVCPAP